MHDRRFFVRSSSCRLHDSHCLRFNAFYISHSNTHTKKKPSPVFLTPAFLLRALSRCSSMTRAGGQRQAPGCSSQPHAGCRCIALRQPSAVASTRKRRRQLRSLCRHSAEHFVAARGESPHVTNFFLARIFTSMPTASSSFHEKECDAFQVMGSSSLNREIHA